jgi:hypothetical protein
MEHETAVKAGRVIALVNQLSALDADGIAERIRKAEVKGQQWTASHCPMAKLLSQELGFEVWVTSTDWRLPGFEDGMISDWQAVGDMPESCTAFVERIDDGYQPYADLIEGEYVDGDFEDEGSGFDEEQFTDYLESPSDDGFFFPPKDN